MIPAALAILIYQILAILGVEAVSQIVTSIAYKRRELDYKLMYLQSPLDLALDYKRFNLTSSRKASIVFLTCLTFVFKFIPTIMTRINSSTSIYYDAREIPLDQSIANSVYHWPSTMPVFDNFVPYLASPTANSLPDMLNTYIKEKLNQNNTRNSEGYWFTPNVSKRFEWDNQQVAFPPGFYAPPVNGPPQRSGMYGEAYAINITGIVFQYDTVTQYSFTTARCVPTSADNVMSNYSAIRGAAVQAARQVLSDCSPVYDSSLVIQTARHSPGALTISPSRLNANDTLYRLPIISEGSVGSSSFGVSIYNHNTSHMTLAIKKTAHLTLYTHGKNATLPLDCTVASRPDTSNNFVDLPYDAILCHIINLVKTGPYDLQFVQASSRKYVDNYVMDTLYSRQRNYDTIHGHVINTSDLIMIDFTSFQSFNVEGNLRDNQEHMIAFSTNSFIYDSASDKESANDLSNDKIGTLLKALDPSRINQDTVDILVGMATMRVRWENGDYSDISLNKAQVMDGIQTPTWWIITVLAMALLFLLPQISRLIIRRIPEYADNLRNLLLLSIERSCALEGINKAKTVGILLRPDDDEIAGHTALLSVNGHSVTVKEKSTSLEGRSTDERTSGVDESHKHIDASLPFFK